MSREESEKEAQMRRQHDNKVRYKLLRMKLQLPEVAIKMGHLMLTINLKRFCYLKK